MARFVQPREKTNMAGEVTLTITGNLTNDPEMRFTPSGSAVANFTIAATPRTFDRNSNSWQDGETLFLRCSVWREAAENVAESLTKGMRVIASGRLKQRSYDKDGEKRTVIEFEVDEIGPSLKNATAKVTRSSKGGGQQQGGQAPKGNQWGGQAPAQSDPWAAPQGQNPAAQWGNGPEQPGF